MATDNIRNYRYNIYINGNETINDLLKLDRETVKLEKDLQKLRNEGKQNTQAYRDLEMQIIKNEQKMQTLRKGIDVNTLSLKQLRNYIQTLNTELSYENPGTKRFKELQAQIQAAKSRMQELNGTAKEGLFSRMADGFNKFAALGATAIASITGLSMTFRKLAEDVARMDDVYADVMKTTGMTRDQVLELNEEFKKMDTRTSREELNLLARDAGKLGLTAKKDIMDFVEAGNQIRVALGEDLGDDAIKSIGKMVNVFSEVSTELQGKDLKEQMLAVGSAVNALGQASTASEPYLVSFAGRLGGIAKQAGISMSAILGFGSSLDQDMQQVEMSASALQKFIVTLAKTPDKIADAVGISKEKLKKAVSEDMNGALMMVFEELNKKGGLVDLAPLFKDLGADGVRAGGVISSIAGSLNQVKDAQLLASQAMIEGTSVTNEYNIKNNNLQAQLKKARKSFKDTALELGESLSPMLLKSTKGTTYLIKALVELPKWLKENKGLIITLVAVLTAYTLAVNKKRITDLFDIANIRAKIAAIKTSTAVTTLDTAAIKSAGVTTRIYIAATQGLAAAKLLLAGNIKAAVVAFKAMAAAMGINPFVLVAAALAAVTVGIYKIVTASTAAEKAVKKFHEEMAVEEYQADQLFNALKKTNEGTEERRVLINKINEKYGDYLTNQLTEKSQLWDIEAAHRAVIAALRDKILTENKLEAQKDVITEYTKKQRDALDDLKSEMEGNKNPLADFHIQNMKNIVEESKTAAEAQKKIIDYLHGSGLNKEDFNYYQYIQKYNREFFKMNRELKDIEDSFNRIGSVGDKPTFEIQLPNEPWRNQNKDNTTPEETEDEKERKKRLAAEAKARREALKKIKEDTQLKLDIEAKEYRDRLKNAGIFEKEMSDMIEQQLQNRLALDEEFFQNVENIALEAEDRARAEALAKQAEAEANRRRLFRKRKTT
ncbi:MAG: phage tail tape measure protein, partial [Prevotellaceae bacterium]|nr:phage tail tape measure protein [Prevotellaceae bacterium]